MVWLIIALIVLVYIVADGFFELSAKLSSWWKLRALPFVRSVGARVFGAVPLKSHFATSSGAAPGPAVSPGEPNNPIEVVPDFSPQQPPVTNSAAGETGFSRERPGVTVSDVFATLWKWRNILIALAIFAIGASIIGGFWESAWDAVTTSRDELQEKLKDANENTEVAEFETKLANQATELAEETHRDRARVARVVAQAEQEIEDAVEAADFDRLYSAYRRAYDGVWSGLEPSDSPNPDPPGLAPMRSPGGDHA